MDERPVIKNINRPDKPGKYKFKPFWAGEDQPVQTVTVYLKSVIFNDKGNMRDELVFDYKNYSILVCATSSNRWFV